MSDSILFSVLVPVYNVEQYIRECLESLVNQNADNYEIILVDDGSTDKSGQICEEYRKKYPNLVKVIHKVNEGLLLARRTAIKASKGKYLVCIDSDDFVERNMLNLLKKEIYKFSPDMIVYHMDRYDGKGYSPFRKTLYASSRLITESEKQEYYIATLLHSISNGMCGKVILRDLIDSETDYLKFKHVSVGEDLLQSLPLITNSTRIYFYNEVLYHYRINLNSVGRVFNYGRYNSMRTVELELGRYVRQWPITNKENYIARHALVETVWGTLRTLSKIDKNLNSNTNFEYIRMISEDKYMIHCYNIIDKRFLNIVQRIVLDELFNKRYNLLINTLKFLRIIKG